MAMASRWEENILWATKFPQHSWGAELAQSNMKRLHAGQACRSTENLSIIFFLEAYKLISYYPFTFSHSFL